MTSKRTPDGITILPRDLHFEMAAADNGPWLDGDPVATAIFNAMSLTFPEGERMFMDAVKAYRSEVSGQLAADVKDFITQAGKGGTPQVSGWLSSYWTLVGLHGVHVFSGILWIFAMIAQIATRGLDDVVKVRLSMLGVFWHFLDLIWVGIFSLVFLVPLA